MIDVGRILVAPLVWLAAFSAIYGLHGLLCSLGVDAGAARWALAGAWVAAILVQVGVLAALYAPRFGAPPGFVRFVSRATGWVGLVAAVWALFPVVATSYCTPPVAVG